MRKNKQGAPILTAKYDVDGSLRYVDFRDLRARRAVNENLSIGDINIPRFVFGNALSTALSEDLQILQRAIRCYDGAISTILRSTAYIHVPTSASTNKSVSIEIV